MSMDTASSKHINELEQQISQLLKALRNAKFQDHPVYAMLQSLEQELSEERRNRYDQNNSEFPGY